jgi:hypothetical protein
VHDLHDAHYLVNSASPQEGVGWALTESYYGKPIQEFFPVGRSLRLSVIPDRMVAKGTVNGILEVEADDDARLD